MSNLKTNRLAFRVDPAIHAQLAVAAQEDRRPMSSLARNILSDWLADRKASHTSKEHPRGSHK
jgi:hypothetical protein